MKRIAFYLGIAAAMVASCSIQEEDFKVSSQDDVVFYASFELPSEGTRVYANEDLLLRWNADDRVSIFNKNTYNQQYRFTGETGDNAGGFRKVDTDEFVTGNAMANVVSVYPYQEGTKITETGTLTLTLPAVQYYAENTFGLGANTMVSVSEDNFLQYKNVGGYLRISLYGEGVSVSSITLKGNDGERIAGKATVTMPLDGAPTAVLADDATDEITLICDTPVELGATVEESTDFWFVVPPVTFSVGFSVTVFGDGGVFVKSTEKTLTLERNKLSKMSPFEAVLSQPNNVIYYTSYANEYGNVVTPNNTDVFGANIVSNEYVNGRGVITFDGDVTSIGDHAFYNCYNLTSISIPSSVTSIGTSAFGDCLYLSSVNIPDGVTSIENGTFLCCRGLESITIPDSVTRIESDAFMACTGLSSITIPDGVTWIGERAFDSCTRLSSITIPSSVTSIGDFAFNSCFSLTSITIPDGVTSLGKCIFAGCRGLTSIDIPDGITSIGDSVFSGCSGLSSIDIPDNVTSIGTGAFSGCSGLTSIIIPDRVTSIGDCAFEGCSGLTNVNIPDGVTSIGDGVFGGCVSILSFSGKYASQDGVFLVDSGRIIAVALGSINGSISLPDGVTSIGGGAFSGCTGLTSIDIPDSVTNIGGGAFSGCSGLSSFDIPDGVTTIGDSAFYGCTGLTSITIPDGVTSIGNGTFSGCTGLISIDISNGLTSIGNDVFSGCGGLTSIDIPDSVTSIGNSAFSGCSGLTAIDIPAGVTSIGYAAFWYCSSLASITIPAGVTSIEYFAFTGCSGLESITVLPVTPPTGGYNMFNHTNNCPIYVPAKSVASYKAAEYWRDCADRIQAIVPAHVWSLIGNLNGTSWNTDFDMENTSGDTWVIRDMPIGATDEFKLRADHDWLINVGGPEGNEYLTPSSGNTYAVFKPTIGTAFTGGDFNIRIGVEGNYTVTFDEAANTILIETYEVFPEHLYMIGEEFGGWDWSSDGVVEMTPVIHQPDWGANAPGQFWTVRYIHAGKHFKFCPERYWAGDFCELGINDGFIVDSGNCAVEEDGFYMVHVDFKNKRVHVEPARVYCIGETFGDWTEGMDAALFKAADGKLSVTVPHAGNLRMYAASSIATSGWWTREFNILDGKITPRVLDELAAVSVAAGAKISLDFNAGTGLIE